MKYRSPADWFAYDAGAIVSQLARTEGALIALKNTPVQRTRLRAGQPSQIHAEIAATCRLAGMGVGTEMDLAMAPAAAGAYDWVRGLAASQPVDMRLICELHSRLTVGQGPEVPGILREKNEQIYFGKPRQRGAKGGKGCRENLDALIRAIGPGGARQLPIVRGLALHYHLLAIHPFRDGNGRTARALETVCRQEAGLRDTHFVSMSSFYADHREAYEGALSASRRAGHDLTPFLEFALDGLELQCGKFIEQVGRQLAVALFENTLTDLFGRLGAGKRRAMAGRQANLLRRALENPGTPHDRLYQQLENGYGNLKNPWKAFLRDIHDLLQIEALELRGGEQAVYARLDWPANITELAFFQHYTDEPRASVVLTPVI